MADKVYLKIDGVVLPVEPGKGYSISYNDYDNTLSTEAGTTVRSLMREGIPSISVSFDCDDTMLAQMRNIKKKESASVYFYDSTAIADVNGNKLLLDMMYVADYSEKMLADTAGYGIWNVNFALEDLGNV